MTKWIAVGQPGLGAGCCVSSDLAKQAGDVFQGRFEKPAVPDRIADPAAFVKTDDQGNSSLHLMIENMHCAACISTIENNLMALPGMCEARVNMSTRRLHVRWHKGSLDGTEIIRTLWQLGYPSAPFDPLKLRDQSKDQQRFLLACMAVAGFASANVMILSIAVWAGIFSDMGGATRNLFHWISALIALPAVAYSGRPFFRSAWHAIRNRRMNMDVPISVAVILAAAISLYQTIQGGRDAYFDASISLLFFLLIGRYLDFSARQKARSVAEHLLVLSGSPARVVEPSGDERLIPADAVRPDMVVSVLPGENIAVDGVIISGQSDIDQSLLNGETMPLSRSVDDRVFAGTLNLSGAIKIRVTTLADSTLLAEIVRLMENSEQGRARYVGLADKAARIYAPVVHILALITFVGWMVLGAGAWEPAIMAAVAVLIITCPCALGLAVPVVQVVSSSWLLKHGVLPKTGNALERMAEIDTVVFDKTGTLTLGTPEFLNPSELTPGDLNIAIALARHSRHPLSKSLVEWADKNGVCSTAVVGDVQEIPGQGLESVVDGLNTRLGRFDWCNNDGLADKKNQDTMTLWLGIQGRPPVCFKFKDQLRSDAASTVERFRKKGLRIALLSGDHQNVVGPVARELGIDDWHSELLPAGKVDFLEKLGRSGHKVLMVGDGLNDAPALSAGYVSMSPAAAADISKSAADFVFQDGKLSSVYKTWQLALCSTRLVKQNFALAVFYNLVAVPMAMAGLATPLIAAVVMSSSSLLVTLNALGLRLRQRRVWRT